jgi:hypothetical protein
MWLNNAGTDSIITDNFTDKFANAFSKNDLSTCAPNVMPSIDDPANNIKIVSRNSKVKFNEEISNKRLNVVSSSSFSLYSVY